MTRQMSLNLGLPNPATTKISAENEKKKKKSITTQTAQRTNARRTCQQTRGNRQQNEAVTLSGVNTRWSAKSTKALIIEPIIIFGILRESTMRQLQDIWKV